MSTIILPSPEIWHRDDFALLCNWRRLYTAVEVGVDRGEFAQCFLSRWLGEDYYGVDSYLPYSDMDYARDADFLTAVDKFKDHPKRAKLLKCDSSRACDYLWSIGQRPDFVYIDAAHDSDSVTRDIDMWWSILSPQGILAGHDFDVKHPGVVKAVVEFADKMEGMTVYLTSVEGFIQEDRPSWYIYKNGIPGKDWRRC